MREAVPVGIGFEERSQEFSRSERSQEFSRSEKRKFERALECSNPRMISQGKIVLEIKNLNVSIGGRKLVNDLDLIVRDGEVAALMGPNGSGKSTLSYVIAGRKNY